MKVNLLSVVVFFAVLSFVTVKGSEVKIFVPLEVEEYEAKNVSHIGSGYVRTKTQIEKRICNGFGGKNSIKTLCDNVEDLKGSLRRKAKTFNDAITLACEGLTWQQNTQKRRLCLKLGFDGKSEDKACRVFGDEPTDNGGNVKDLCARIERIDTKIANRIASLKATAKAICNGKNFGTKTKKGRLCTVIKQS